MKTNYYDLEMEARYCFYRYRIHVFKFSEHQLAILINTHCLIRKANKKDIRLFFIQHYPTNFDFMICDSRSPTLVKYVGKFDDSAIYNGQSYSRKLTLYEFKKPIRIPKYMFYKNFYAILDGNFPIDYQKRIKKKKRGEIHG